MQFQVPQFIDVEDKIFGPLTFRQFIYLLGGGGASFIIYKLIPYTYLALLVSSPIVILALALAFYKFNDRPFVFALESAFRYYITSKLFLWKKISPKKEAGSSQTSQDAIVGLSALGNPRMTSERLRDISWSLDVHEKITKR